MAHGHSPDEIDEMLVRDVEAVAMYHLTHNPILNFGHAQ